jgi:carboxyl-terminal processing protease
MFKQKTTKKSKIILVFIIAFFTFGFVNKDKFFDNYFEITKNIDIFTRLVREINMTYVDDVEPNKFFRTGIDAMLKSLDPYTQFISASEIEDYRFMSTGQYGGIGATISKRNGKVIVVEPYPESPAYKAGIRIGDEILQIDNEKIENSKLENTDIRNLLRGQPKTKVKVVVKKPKGNIETYLIERDEIKVKNVPYFGMVDKEIGYIVLTGFTKDAANEVKQAFENLRSQNPQLKGIILDLRGNPGGLLFEAIEIANLFIPKGEKVVETKGKMEGSNKVYYAKNTPLDLEIPIAVIINGKSASASEIVSGVLQDLDRGVVIGRKSFGKGLVQATRPLSYNTQLKVTTSKYYTPSGRCIQAIDYGNRDEDGSATKIPDSLKKPFKTKAGRTVYDGGGIEPDILVEEKALHKITEELLFQYIIFDFATEFVNQHPTIAPAKDFVVTDDIYNQFVQFAQNKMFKFETQSEKHITEAEKIFESDGYTDLKTDLQELKNKLALKKKDDILKYKSEIIPFLQREIVSRYYLAPGAIENSFLYDKDILEAKKILHDKNRYQAILKK